MTGTAGMSPAWTSAYSRPRRWRRPTGPAGSTGCCMSSWPNRSTTGCRSTGCARRCGRTGCRTTTRLCAATRRATAWWCTPSSSTFFPVRPRGRRSRGLFAAPACEEHIMPTIYRDAKLAVVGTNGGVWVAPLGTAQPPDPEEQPPAPWLAIGAISTDGLTNGVEEDTEQFTPWGLTSPFRTVVTRSVRTFSFTAWEINRPIGRALQNRLEVDDLQPDLDGIVRYAESGTAEPDRRSWLIDVYDGQVWER